MARTLLSFIIIIIISVFVSCKSGKETSNTKYERERQGDLKIEQAYIQQEIPGTEGEKIKQYLTIKIASSEFALIEIDSVYLKDLNYYTSSQKTSVYQTNPIRLSLEKNKTTTFVNHGGEPQKEAIIFFTRNNQNYQQTVSPILVKEPIYLP